MCDEVVFFLFNGEGQDARLALDLVEVASFPVDVVAVQPLQQNKQTKTYTISVGREKRESDQNVRLHPCYTLTDTTHCHNITLEKHFYNDESELALKKRDVKATKRSYVGLVVGCYFDGAGGFRHRAGPEGYTETQQDTKNTLHSTEKLKV